MRMYLASAVPFPVVATLTIPDRMNAPITLSTELIIIVISAPTVRNLQHLKYLLNQTPHNP